MYLGRIIIIVEKISCLCEIVYFVVNPISQLWTDTVTSTKKTQINANTEENMEDWKEASLNTVLQLNQPNHTEHKKWIPKYY